MSQNKISPDDPRLTAYALGELDGADLAAIEAALRNDPAARAAVADVRATATQLTAALAAEPLPETEPVSRPMSAPVRATVAPSRTRGPVGKLFEFPQFYYVAGGLAAACFAVFVALRPPVPHAYKTPGTPPTGDAVRTEIVFAPPTPPTPPTAEPAPTPAAASEATPATATAVTETVASLPGPAPAEMLPPVTADENKTAVATTVSTPVALPPPLPPEKDLTLLGSVQTDVTLHTTAPMVGAPAVGVGVATPAPVVVPKENRASLLSAFVAGDIVKLDAYEVAADREGVARSIASQHTGFGMTGRTSLSLDEPERSRVAFNTEGYAFQRDNDFLGAAKNPLSTFAIDVDTASYANVRRFLRAGRLPPADAVRVEELVNYFPYRYPAPRAPNGGGGNARADIAYPPFAAALEVASAPWAPSHRLVRIGLKGREVGPAARPAANLVFLLDVSGSMNEPNKLPLVKESMRLLVGQLRPDDRVAIVAYAGHSGLALPSTPAAKAAEILATLDALKPDGATHGAMGIHLAYDIAKANLVDGGLNRVILCTDGDFNVGVTGEGPLARLVEEKAKSGVGLSVLGFGMGNYKDSLLELLADKGNGNYGYIDTRREAEKLLVEQISGTLHTIAKDVKVQVEFNPAKVSSYRLIGYENRLLKKEDFNHDQVEAGEIGAGHTVTALYEIVPVNSKGEAESIAYGVDDLKYLGRPTVTAPPPTSNELLTVKVRYKEPAGEVSRKLDFTLVDKGAQFAGASADFQFAAAVAGFGMILRDSPHRGTATLGNVLAWAGQGSKDDPGGYRGEFLSLVNSAQGLTR